ncbi:type I secretion system permease/ATPase [Pseudosulfitobacter pseudonitzschiae]|uniref:type I secretion system permease/ATPase n=1 Tax=Pseudosulfitobacter pseudonitzschiae TaxID=1402135 RepID=UPI003B80F52F
MIKQEQLSQSVVDVMKHYGLSLSETELHIGLEGDDASETRLMSVATRDLRRHGFLGEWRDIQLSNIPALAYPALLVMKTGDILILHEIHDGSARLSAPAIPDMIETFPLSEIVQSYSGKSLIIKPENSARMMNPEDYPKEKTNWLLAPVLRNLSVYRDVFTVALVANLLAAGIALFAMQVYDRVIPNEAFDTLWILASGVGIAAVMEFGLRLIRSHMIEISGRDIDIQLSSSLYRHVMGIRMEHQPKSVGSFISQIRELSSVREFLTTNTVSSLSDLPFALVFLVIIGMIGGPVALVVICAAMLSILPGLIFGKKLSRYSRNGTKEGAIYTGLLYETLSNVETLKSIGAETRMMKRHEDLAAVVAVTTSRSRLLTSTIMQIASVAQQASYVGVIIVGAYQISAGAMTTGALVACTILSSRTLSPMNQIGQLVTRWQMVKSSAQNINKIMEMPADREPGKKFARPTGIKGHYGFEGLEFSHQGTTAPALKIGNLHINAGEHVAVLGGIGSGKTTLLRVMSGLCKADKGAVLLDGISVPNIDPSIRTRRIGYLPQNVGIFQGTLRENLMSDGRRFSDEDAHSVLDAVGLGQFVRAHPDGLDMNIQASSVLSGGQRQVIGLARLILQDPDVVLLDEPTASLDPQTEMKIVEFLQEWLKGRTLVMATHKREVLPLTERALVLVAGHVAKDTPIGAKIHVLKPDGAMSAGVKEEG